MLSSGFDYLKSFFLNLYKKDLFSHSYLFFGEKDIGKSDFVKSLAFLLSSGEFRNVGGNDIIPETLIIDRSVSKNDKETDNVSLEVKLDDIRNIIGFLYQKPNVSKFRCVVIVNLDRLNYLAQDALLKVLEEPPEHGIILATTSNIDAIKDTVVSRFAKIYIPKQKKEYILDFIKEYGKINIEKIEELVNRSNGKIIKAKRLINRDESLDLSYNIVKKIFDIKKNDKEIISDVLKILLEDSNGDKLLEDFFEELFTELRRDPVKNYKIEDLASRTLFFIRSLRVNRYLHLKNLLWKTRLYLRQLRY